MNKHRCLFLLVGLLQLVSALAMDRKERFYGEFKLPSDPRSFNLSQGRFNEKRLSKLSDDRLSQVIKLDLSGNGLKAFPKQLLKRMPNLLSLNVSGNSIAEWESLPYLPQLQKLDMSGNSLKTLRWMPNMPELRELNVSGNQLDSLRWISDMPKLKMFNVANNDESLLDHILEFDEWGKGLPKKNIFKVA
jgi:Leucine-rich repeat (LRR) protein